MAVITAPEPTAAQHQSLLHFVGEGNWSDDKALAKLREMVLSEIERHDRSLYHPKRGQHSVGVGRQ